MWVDEITIFPGARAWPSRTDEDSLNDDLVVLRHGKLLTADGGDAGYKLSLSHR